MKKIIYFIAVSACMLLASCQHKEQPGMTATVDMAGQWYVQCDLLDGDEVIAEDVYGYGHFLVYTYNTAANDPKEMFLEDSGNFWDFKIRIACDPAKKTFSASAAQNCVEDYEDLVCDVTNGKIIYGGATTPSGQKADLITFDIVFSDDDPGIVYRMSGWRYTGFEVDD